MWHVQRDGDRRHRMICSRNYAAFINQRPHFGCKALFKAAGVNAESKGLPKRGESTAKRGAVAIFRHDGKDCAWMNRATLFS